MGYELLELLLFFCCGFPYTSLLFVFFIILFNILSFLWGFWFFYKNTSILLSLFSSVSTVNGRRVLLFLTLLFVTLCFFISDFSLKTENGLWDFVIYFPFLALNRWRSVENSRDQFRILSFRVRFLEMFICVFFWILKRIAVEFELKSFLN